MPPLFNHCTNTEMNDLVLNRNPFAAVASSDEMPDGPELDEDFDPDVQDDYPEFDDEIDARDPYDIEYDH